MIAVGVGTAVGLNTLLFRKIGQHKGTCQAATTGLFLMLITSLIFSVAGIFFSYTSKVMKVVRALRVLTLVDDKVFTI